MANQDNDQQTVHLLHIGKTGGTAVKSVLKRYSDSVDSPLVLHAHKSTLADVPVGEKVVMFLRDPVSRFISGFYSRQRKGQPRYLSEWKPFEEKVFAAFSTPAELASALLEPTHEHHDVARMAMKRVMHLRQYRFWYGDLDYFRSRLDDILFVGFQESLDADFAILKGILSIPATELLPTDDVSAHRNPADLDRYIPPEGISCLRQWYAEDYEFIELCRSLR